MINGHVNHLFVQKPPVWKVGGFSICIAYSILTARVVQPPWSGNTATTNSALWGMRKWGVTRSVEARHLGEKVVLELFVVGIVDGLVFSTFCTGIWWNLRRDGTLSIRFHPEKKPLLHCFFSGTRCLVLKVTWAALGWESCDSSGRTVVGVLNPQSLT